VDQIVTLRITRLISIMKVRNCVFPSTYATEGILASKIITELQT